MKTISRISILTIASLHGGLFHFLLNVNSNFSKKGRKMPFVGGKGSTSGPLHGMYMHGFFSSHSLNMWETPREAQHNGGNEKPLIIPICSERYVQPNQFFTAWPDASAASSVRAQQLAGSSRGQSMETLIRLFYYLDSR